MRTTSRTVTPHAHGPALSSTSVAPGLGGCASARHARQLWAARRAPGQRPGRWEPPLPRWVPEHAGESTLPLARGRRVPTNPGDNMFRFDYSPAFLRWALSPPGFKPEWHVGVRVTQARRRAREPQPSPSTFTLHPHLNLHPTPKLNRRRSSSPSSRARQRCSTARACACSPSRRSFSTAPPRPRPEGAAAEGAAAAAAPVARARARAVAASCNLPMATATRSTSMTRRTQASTAT